MNKIIFFIELNTLLFSTQITLFYWQWLQVHLWTFIFETNFNGSPDPNTKPKVLKLLKKEEKVVS